MTAAITDTVGRRQAGDRYSLVAIVLHWAIAALILFNLSIGFFMEGWPPALRRPMVGAHLSSGLTVLALTAVRVVWRLTHRPPALPQDMPVWEQVAAHAAHLALYAMMVVLPISGWCIISAHVPHPGAGVWFWGLVHLPPISLVQHIDPDPAIMKLAHDRFVTAHAVLALILIALLVLHLAGALKHQLFDGHAELARMGLGRTKSPHIPQTEDSK